ncbi:MAG TPA: nitroreductase family protein [Candidatus Omnitrophota bacterium]|nr:nitroreductase family protein [Candidatus Omnitrophota bacterium]HPD84251.1 nitroreductase family protein [Candidatus Omnitrophota bacterium]HRZ03107.1 nitroreductase family protein [Candidatus Omnitrophota bacterium]
MKAIFERRSIRKYKPDPLTEETIREILEAAMAAPSAGNEQPWEFIVINNRTVLNEIPKIHPHASMTKEAPVAILVCGNLKKEVHKDLWPQDCAAAVENILLTVTDKGLGAVWTAVYPREERVAGMRKLLNIPEHVVPFALIPIGYPAEEKPPIKRFDAARIHYNKW